VHLVPRPIDEERDEMSRAAVQSDLVYDIGLHDGEDTRFYLENDFRVVAVDANPACIRGAAQRFEGAIREGRLTLVHAAVAAHDTPASVTFHLSAESSWSSLLPGIAGRDRTPMVEIEVPATTVRDLLARFGTPYYLKVDIEGADDAALESLNSTPFRPTYVSVEAECAPDSGTGDDDALRKLELLGELGYRRFKLVDQDSLRVLSQADVWLGPRRDFRTQLLARLRRQGAAVAHTVRFRGSRMSFPFGATGPFGDDLAGEWLDASRAAELLVAARHAYSARDDARPYGFWCDWHAGI
jgi:FkbM family methyltransferase